MPFTSGWMEAHETQCRKCHKKNVVYKQWESSDGGHEDLKFMCREADCGHEWWVDGPDA